MPATASASSAFSLDVLGRYVCNTFDEALDSQDSAAHPDARPFDLFVLGGGSFGAALASHLFMRDVSHTHRVLVLEAGPMVLAEHVQNLPPGMGGAFDEVRGVPWNSDSPMSFNREFPGLAFCVGGRSLFWGGWSPYLIDSELPTPPWPAEVTHDLTQAVPAAGNPPRSYLDAAAEQIGTDVQNDFVSGALHTALRDRLYSALSHRPAGQTKLTGQRGKLTKIADLEAPLAVQSSSPRAGFFPFNKFNGAQLLIRAARLAQAEAEQSADGDLAAKAVKKRLMVVDNTHVIRLERAGGGRRVTRIVTNRGAVDVPPDGKVFLALGTIESTRLALTTLPNARGLIGRNLMAHLRSNLTVRVPRASFNALNLAPGDLQVSALFVKGLHQHADGTTGHFHVQITASGVGALGMDSEAELFKKIPDIDTLDRFAQMTDPYVVITLRGIGEMTGDRLSADPQNRVTLDLLGPQGAYDYGQPRALARLEAGPKDASDPRGDKDLRLWDAMDQACDELARIFANGGALEYLITDPDPARSYWDVNPPPTDALRDKLSSTHHEGGTLWMGADPDAEPDPARWGVTDAWGKFHEADNLYAIGPALLPTLGSPNPMLTGVALARRLGDHIIAPPAAALEPGFRALFDGTEATLNKWRMAGVGAFALIDGALVAQPGGDLGLLYYATEQFGDYTLRVDFRLARPTGPGNDNSGVFVRFRDPRRPVQATGQPYGNQAYVAVDTGFEVQIDEEARGNPDGRDKHRTGALYDIPTGQDGEPVEQHYQRRPLTAGAWNTFEITVSGDTYTVALNGQQCTSFTNAPGSQRGHAPAQDSHCGYIGLQAHTGQVAFANVRIKTA